MIVQRLGCAADGDYPFKLLRVTEKLELFHIWGWLARARDPPLPLLVT